ncbi:MAG: dehypoxanthine futalosine cyclase [Helicobacteraceae bacterium]|jgi:cyclic dehypoxanthinyl futalosine synthase|nr:dehypoxanthine futalosine cyclase [Helicobacteraceae bacterium]
MSKRIGNQEALELLEGGELLEIGSMALERKREKHGARETTFVIDRNINYTNICHIGCKFCAFHKNVNEEGGYILPYETIDQKIEELLAIGGTQILFQGGVHPHLGIDYYTDLVSHIRTKFPAIDIHGFSAVEVAYIAKKSGISTIDVLRRLNECGMESMPGAGAEILSDRVRSFVSPGKVDKEEWLRIHKEAHSLGMTTSATMVFGLGESDLEIVEHLECLRALQDETGGFTAFIPWSYQPDFTPLQKIRPDLGKQSPNRYLRILAFSRLYLDNFQNIQSSWVTQGSYIGQLALRFGANDLGSTMMEENVVAATGCSHSMATDEMIALIKGAGEIPVQRNTRYKHIRRFA